MAERRVGSVGQVALVARTVLVESRRRPGAWTASALVGVLFAGLLLVVGVVSGQVQDLAEDRVIVVGVGGDREGGEAVLAALEDERLALRPTEDPEGDVLERRVAASVELPTGVDAAVAAGRPVEVIVRYRATEAVSDEARLILLRRLQAAEVAALTEGSATSAPVALEVTGVLRDAEVARVRLARQVGAVAALLCLGVVTAVAGVLGGAREQRTLEPLLVLPLSRRSLAAGVALGSLPLAALQVVAGVVLLLLTAAVPGSAAHQTPSVLAAMVLAGIVAAVPLAAVAGATGVVAGSLGTGTDDAVSLGDLLALPFVGVGIALFAAPAWAPGLWAYAAPGLGQALLVRDAVAGAATVAEVGVAVASAVLTWAALAAVAGRLVGDERRILRAVR